MTAGTAIYAPAPAPQWVQLTERAGELDAAIQRDLMAFVDLIYQIAAAWEVAGRPGGSLVRALDDYRSSRGLKPWGTQVYAWKDAGEARARGISAPTAGEAARAGQALREALPGRSVQEAVQVVQERVDAGDFKRGKNPAAPEGSTVTFIPVSAVKNLNDVLERVAHFAGDGAPVEKQDRLAMIAENLAGREDLQRAVAAPQDWIAIEREQALELRRLAMIGREVERSENQNGGAV